MALTPAVEQLKHHLKRVDPSDMEQGGPLWHLYREACASSLYFFAKAVWITIPEDRNVMSRGCHLPMCLALEDDSIKRLLIEWPRRHMKTTLASQARPVHKLVRRVVASQDTSDRFAIYSFSKLNAQRIWREIKWTFQENQFFQFLFPELIPDFAKVDVWNMSEGIVPRIYQPKEPTFDTLGGGAATGRHYDDITEDDMITEVNFREPGAVERAVEYHRQCENLLEDVHGRIIIVGNRWSFFDLNHVIHTEEPGTSVISVSVRGPKLSGKYKCRNLPEPVMELLKAMPDPIWPERFTAADLQQVLEKAKPRIYSAQYLNEPTDPDVVDFKLDWLKYVELEYREGLGPCLIYEDDPEPMPLSGCNLYITWDPALGGRSAKSENAIAVSAVDYKGRASLIREYVKKEDPYESMKMFLEFARRYSRWLKATGMEEVLFQKVLGDKLQAEAKAAKIDLRMKKLKTPTGQRKDQRIRTALTSWFEGGQCYIRRGCVRFVEQYTSFGIEDAPRDLIDAFAYAPQLWVKPPDPEQEAIDERRARRLKHHLGITGYGSALG